MLFEDVEVVSRSLPSEARNGNGGENGGAQSITEESRLLLLSAALIGEMCLQRQLHVICLQPFRNFEGLLDGGSRQGRLVELKLWCHLADLLSTDPILVPTSFLPADCLSNNILADVVTDLRAAAALAAQASPPVRVCYEALAWGTHVDTWEQSWELVCLAHCSNLGICLYTFNIAARVCAADPALETETTLAKDGAADDGASHHALLQFMERLMTTVGVAGKNKVFLVQIADGEALPQPLAPGHQLYVAEQPALMSWSRNCRLFYGEAELGGCLPVQTIAWHISCKLGYTGWVSFEVFHRRLSDLDPGVPDKMARRGADSWAKLVKDMMDIGFQDGNAKREKPRKCARACRKMCKDLPIMSCSCSSFGGLLKKMAKVCHKK